MQNTVLNRIGTLSLFSISQDFLEWSTAPVFSPALFPHILCVNVYHFILSKNERLAHSPVRDRSQRAKLWRNEERKEKEWKRLVNNARFVCENSDSSFCVYWNLSIPHVWQWKPVCCSIAQISVCKQEGKHHRDVGQDRKGKEGWHTSEISLYTWRVLLPFNIWLLCLAQ